MIKHLVRAIAPLLFDSLGMILFATLLALHVGIVPATRRGVAIASAVVG
jgi:hypothetical protein